MLASASTGFLRNLSFSHWISGARSRSNIHSARPSVHMFLQRRASLLPSPNGLTASSVSALISKAITSHLARLPSSSGETAYFAFSRLRLVNSPLSAMISPPGLSACTLVFSAAGFIATSTSGASPAVSIAVDPKLIWNAETPNSVPCGARISAGKSGNVARSLPASAVERVNCPPVSCIPSPESPAKRTTTASGSGALPDDAGDWVLASTVAIVFLDPGPPQNGAVPCRVRIWARPKPLHPGRRNSENLSGAKPPVPSAKRRRARLVKAGLPA